MAKRKIKSAKKTLEDKAPKGEFLAYINKKEAKLLKKLGGSGKKINGIPSFWDSEDTSGGGYSEAEANAAGVDTSQDSSYGGSDGENDSWGTPGSSQAMKDAVDAINNPDDDDTNYTYGYGDRYNQQRGISNAKYGMFNYTPSMMALDALRAINPYGDYSTTGPDANTVEGGDNSDIPLRQNQFNSSLINDSSLYTPEQIDYRLFESSKNPFYSLRPNINSGGRIGYAEGSKPKGIKYLLGY